MKPYEQETRVVDPNTGGAKGSKLARFDLMPWAILREVAEHFGRGARKYDERNWERGYAWSLSFAALHRHLDAFWARDSWDMDPSLFDEGQPRVSHSRHIIAVVWHALVLAFFERFNRGTDDRPIEEPYSCEPPTDHPVRTTALGEAMLAAAERNGEVPSAYLLRTTPGAEK